MPGHTGGIVEYEMPGDVTTYTAGATITGGQVVAITGADRTVQPAGATSLVAAGVALHDAASGDTDLAVARVGVWPLTAAGAITRGARVKAGAAGTVSAWVSGTDSAAAIIGYALEAIGDTLKGRIRLTGL